MPKRVGEGAVVVPSSPVTSTPVKTPVAADPVATSGWQPKTPPRRNLEDPAVLQKNRDAVQWKPTDGSLFVDGVGADDPLQGAIGDCYLVSGLASLANVQPDVIRNAIKDNGDGTYTVAFSDPWPRARRRSSKTTRVPGW